MIRRFFVIVALGVGLIQTVAGAAQSPEDELRMKEHMIALSQGAGSVADLHIELMDGSMHAFSSYEIVNGKLMCQVTGGRPGWPEKRSERAVTDEEVRALLRELVAKQYWTFKGTKRTPDVPNFMFRFYDKDLQSVDYSCDANEYEQSPERSAIRSVLLTFVAGGLPEKLGTATSQPIPEQLRIADAPKTARHIDAFRSLTRTMRMSDVVRRCGIPDGDLGSGIYIFTYHLDDGSTVAIGTPDLMHLLYVTQIDGSGKRTPLLLEPGAATP